MAAFAMLALASAAASPAEPPLTRTEPVVVTATRFQDRVTDKPVNLVVITADDIRSSPAKTVPDLLAEQAGIAIHDFFGNNAATTTVDMRGFGITGTQNTLILVDGRRVVDIDLSGVQWSAVPLHSIERIEIVRGGGSVLYGEGATAGVINIITRSPPPGTRELTLRGSVGSYDTREGAAHGGIALGSVRLGVIGSHFESDGYRRNNHNRQTNALAQLRWSGAPGEFILKLSADDQGIRLPGARQVQPSAGVNELVTDRRGAQTPLDWAQREGRRALFDWIRATPFGEVTVEAGWREKIQRSFFDQQGFPDFRDIDLAVWSLTPRVKVNVPVLGRANTLTAGVDWYSWDYVLKRSNAPGSIAQPFNRVDAREDTIGVYALDTLSLTEQVSVSMGARREHLRLDATDRFNPSAPGGAFGSGAPAGSQRLNEHAYELGMRYQVLPAAAVIAKTARSFRFANVDEIYETSPAFTSEFQFLRPQTARSHELTFELARAAARTRATLFQIDVDDEIHLDPFTTGVGNRNLPPSRRQGVELEILARPHAKLNVAGSYSYIRARFREGVLTGGASTQENVNIAGKTVPLVPRHKASLRASWDFTPETRLSGLLSYVSDQFMDNDEPNSLGTKIPSYTLLDLKLTHRIGEWLLAASVNNVFDKKYYNYAVRSQFVADRYNAYPLPERNGMLTLEYRLR
jgi:iron complex outermembrane receptor protein